MVKPSTVLVTFLIHRPQPLPNILATEVNNHHIVLSCDLGVHVGPNGGLYTPTSITQRLIITGVVKPTTGLVLFLIYRPQPLLNTLATEVTNHHIVL
jgi:hypothetical protein